MTAGALTRARMRAVLKANINDGHVVAAQTVLRTMERRSRERAAEETRGRGMSPADIRLSLLRAGFSPLPVMTRAKRPPMDEWQKLRPTEDDIAAWDVRYPEARSTGVLTRTMPTLDIDITDPEAAAAVERLIRVSLDGNGRVLVRFGQWPKRAMPLRTDVPFKKITANLIAPDGSDGQKIELLADGQQVVCFGDHASTGKPYWWHGGKPGEIGRDELADITEAAARELVEAVVGLLIERHGYRRAPKRPKGNGHDTDPDRAPADWAYLTQNILAGRELHDSLRDLAGKLIASGMGHGAAVNYLRGLMQASQSPHDERWQERYDDIPRLVNGVTQPAEPAAPEPEHGNARDREQLTIAAWLARDLPPRDHIFRGVFDTTSRVLVVGDTGVGKTLWAVDFGCAAAAGVNFLGWEAVRRCRVLYLDGELPRQTFRERLVAAAAIYGGDIPFYGYNRDDLAALQRDMPPLNTPQGKAWLWHEVNIVKPDLIIFDAIMSLLLGPMKDEEPWAGIADTIRALSSRHIGQLWLHHTGHDASRSYGTKTREWEMDSVVMFTKSDGEDDRNITMEFRKARLRTPETAGLYLPQSIRRDEHGWVTAGTVATHGREESAAKRKRRWLLEIYDDLAVDAELEPGHNATPVRKVAIHLIRTTMIGRGYLTKGDDGRLLNSESKAFNRATDDLIGKRILASDGTRVWRIQ